MFNIPHTDGALRTVRWCVMGWWGSGSQYGVELLQSSRDEDGAGTTTTWRLRLRLTTRTGGTMANIGGWTGSSYSSKQVSKTSYTSLSHSKPPFLVIQLWNSIFVTLIKNPSRDCIFDVHRCPGLYERKIKKILSIFLLFCKCNM